ncbi:MAG: HPr family phosphocarrier protein [Gammaproteobacteria bacterium]|nr:HPr family phosphocarrier protein [Gammaproteobacteria bacterium]MCY4358727.1 HPr family phosphocarrier protein [Gammaproteobacteria bacterium]
MAEAQIEIINKAGLHARAASKLADLCGTYGCDIRIGQEKMVDGKSVLSLMMLAAVRGTNLKVVTEGPNADKALRAILTLINNRFDEAE